MNQHLAGILRPVPASAWISNPPLFPPIMGEQRRVPASVFSEGCIDTCIDLQDPWWSEMCFKEGLKRLGNDST